MNQRLIDFYRDIDPDSEGRMLVEMWGWSDEKLEVCHDYIQWWFPTLTKSMFNEDAPEPDEEDMILFRSDSELKNNLSCSFYRFLVFLGLQCESSESAVCDHLIPSPNFDKKRYIWSEFNHNHLRITRVLESLRLLGLKVEAELLLNFLESANKLYGTSISTNTLSHWRDTRKWDQILNEKAMEN
jgi:hypothetical protein